MEELFKDLIKSKDDVIASKNQEIEMMKMVHRKLEELIGKK
jgi:hypothetical protein